MHVHANSSHTSRINELEDQIKDMFGSNSSSSQPDQILTCTINRRETTNVSGWFCYTWF
jgi:hypothetical protein